MDVSKPASGDNGRKRDDRGFTLVELLIVIVVVGVVTAAIYSVYTSTLKSYVEGSDRIRSEMNARAALELIASELRMAGYNHPDHAFLDAKPDSVTFAYDKNGNGGASPDDDEKITFKFENNTIKKQFNGSGSEYQPIAEEIKNLAFTYRNAGGGETSTLAAIRTVQIRIQGVNSKQEHSITVFCRNMGG